MPKRALIKEQPKQAFKLLIAVPATKTSHLPFQAQVLAAIHRTAEGYEFDLDIGVANESGWQFVVDRFNCVADRVVAEGYDYVLIIESDVLVPPNALLHLLSVDADAAVATVKFHRFPSNPALDEAYRDMVCVGEFLQSDPALPDQMFTNGFYMKDVENRVLTFRDNPKLMAGTGCILVKRSVFERGIRFCNLVYASYDVFFWRDIADAGFTGAVDGFVVCDHLGM